MSMWQHHFKSHYVQYMSSISQGQTNKMCEDTGNSPPPPLSLPPLILFWETLHLKLWMGPIRRFQSHISQGHKKATPSSPRTSLFSLEMTPLFNQLWIMKFCTRDPFSLHLTVIELHSHAIPFTTAMKREAGEGLCVWACARERWRRFPCDIMGCWMAALHRDPSLR